MDSCVVVFFLIPISNVFVCSSTGQNIGSSIHSAHFNYGTSKLLRMTYFIESFDVFVTVGLFCFSVSPKMKLCERQRKNGHLKKEKYSLFGFVHL